MRWIDGQMSGAAPWDMGGQERRMTVNDLMLGWDGWIQTENPRGTTSLQNVQRDGVTTGMNYSFAEHVCLREKETL